METYDTSKMFGRLVPPGDPSTWRHTTTYPYSRLGFEDEYAVETEWLRQVPEFLLPNYREFYNQMAYNNGKGCQGCLGYSWSEWLTFVFAVRELVRYRETGGINNPNPNREPQQSFNAVKRAKFRLFYAPWLYHQSQLTDNDPNTNPEADNGGYMYSSALVLKNTGHVRATVLIKMVENESILKPRRYYGINYYYWCVTLQQVINAVAHAPIVAGIPWYEEFMTPTERYVMVNGRRRREYWIGTHDNLGKILGGHAVCLCDISTSREGGLILGTWGLSYPPVWIGFERLNRMIAEYAEFCAPEVYAPVN